MTSLPTYPLSPAQQRARDDLIGGLRVASAAVLAGTAGIGKTGVLAHVHRALGGAFLTIEDFMEAMGARHPLALEETFFHLVREALREHDVVVMDDVDLISNVVSCGSFYPRPNFVQAPLIALAAHAAGAGKKLVLGSERGQVPLWGRAHVTVLDELAVVDYEFIGRAHLGAERAGVLDYRKIHRFSPKLSARHLGYACDWLRDDAALDTDRFMEFLRARYLASNVDLGEVQAVALSDLKGVDDVIRALEANIVLPLENVALAAELDLKPKRGVLLAGPPGTGKTTVGRALAHRLRSKFFLVDGTFISGTGAFYARIAQVFEAAKQNAPAVIFIDDSDVIFESGGDAGLYRYLLTMLDGLESTSAGRICVMMTAMDVGNLPPALIRSGRIELWLETRLPDEAARAAILADRVASLPPAMGPLDVARLAEATEGLSGADLKRLVEDGKILFAFDLAQGRAPRPAVEYCLTAADTVRANKERYAEAEARARQRHPVRPPWFDTGDDGMAGYAPRDVMGLGGGQGFPPD